MKYIEGFHGIFRDYEGKPSVWELAQYRKEFYEENPDVPRLDRNQFFNIYATLIGVGLFVGGFIFQKENLIMIGLAGAILYNAISYVIGYAKSNFPKEEKSRYILPVVALGGSFFPFVYNVLRLFNIIPASNLGSNIIVTLMFGWVAVSTLLMELFYALKMNIMCREKTDGILIGYSDYETTDSSGHHNDHVREVVGSKYVYSFDVDGETYKVVTPYGTVNNLFHRRIGSSHVIKYNANNPEFCMVKHFEISSIITGLVVAIASGFFAYAGFASIINHDLQDPFGENANMPAIIVVDEDGSVHGIDEVQESIDASIAADAEPTGTPTPTPAPRYSDEWVIENYDTEDFVCYVYPVVSIEGDNAYMGTVPGLYSRYIPAENLEVGDDVIFINFRGSYLYYKLDEGESYTGTHSPEDRGWVAEDGRIIFGEDYVNFYYGDGYEICTYTVLGQDGDVYMIGCDEYYYEFSNAYIEDFDNWNTETGHVYYAARNDTSVFIVDSDLFVLDN